MSLPRVLTLDGDDTLRQTPAPELQQLRGKHLHLENLSLKNESKRVDDAQGDTLEIIAEFIPNDAAAFGLKVRCSEDGQNAVTLRYANGILNAAGTEVPITNGEELKRLKLHVFLDRSVMELFINDGRMSVTRVNYPGENDLGIAVFSENGNATLRSLDIWQLQPIWKQKQGAQYPTAITN
jgi:beta-fructofuranosidase